MNRTIDEIQKAIAEKQETLARLENKFGGRFPAHEKEIEFLFEELHRLKVHDRNVWEADTRKRAALTADIPFDRLRELVEADKDGRCVVLPCKVGDAVYAYDDVFNQIAPFQVDMVELYGHKGIGFCANWRKGGELMADLDFDRDDLGKTVFLTLTEAETALQEGAKHERD